MSSKKQTNGDRIRAMSNDELSAWHENACPPGDYASRCQGGICEECWKNWLDAEVEQ